MTRPTFNGKLWPSSQLSKAQVVAPNWSCYLLAESWDELLLKCGSLFRVALNVTNDVHLSQVWNVCIVLCCGILIDRKPSLQANSNLKLPYWARGLNSPKMRTVHSFLVPGNYFNTLYCKLAPNDVTWWWWWCPWLFLDNKLCHWSLGWKCKGLNVIIIWDLPYKLFLSIPVPPCTYLLPHSVLRH